MYVYIHVCMYIYNEHKACKSTVMYESRQNHSQSHSHLICIHHHLVQPGLVV